MADDLKSTVLHEAHVALGARMVPFAGYAMPVQYPDGIMAEHKWTRENAGAFDVSHMGPFFLTLKERSGDHEADHAAIAAIAETLGPRDLTGLKPGQIRYTVLLNDAGGMIDDLMIARPVIPERAGMLYVVVNAGGKDRDFSLFEAVAAGRATLTRADDRALIAVQGPRAAAVIAGIFPEAAGMGFMTLKRLEYEGEGVIITRSGYTGEDGYEILVMPKAAASFWNRLLADPRVKPIGLGARDSLRLEAGLPLYGHDADEGVSPIEAGLGMAVSPSRQRKGDFPGAARIERELTGGLTRVRAGLLVEGAPAREGAEIADASGAIVGVVTSGGFSPTLGRPIAMGFVPPALAKPGTQLSVIVRGRVQPAVVTDLPFVPHRYFRKALETVRMRFTKDHEWVELAGDIATVGITAYAANALGDVVFVETPDIGKVVKAGDNLAVVESVKAASDVYAPVSGEVVEANTGLSDTPESVNQSPEQDAWFVKLKVSDAAQVDALMDRDAYETFLGTL